MMAKQIAQYTQYTDFVHLSADGKHAISVFNGEGMDYGVVAWNPKTGQEIKRHLLKAPVNHVMLSPDGQHALIVTHIEKKQAGTMGRELSEYDIEDTVIIWNIDQDTIKQHSFPYHIVDGVWLDNTHILISSITTLMMWDASLENNNGQIPTVYRGDGWEYHLLYDGEKVIFFQFNKANTLETLFIKPHTWEIIRERESLQDGFRRGHSWYFEPRLKQIALSPNRDHFVMLLENQPTLVIRPVSDPAHSTQKLENDKKIAAVAWSPDSTRIAFAEFDSLGARERTRKNRVWIWSIATGEKTLFAELDYDYEYTYGANQDQKAWGTREIQGLHWHKDLIYIQYGKETLVWEV